MSPSTQVLLSSALTFGVPLAFAIREVLSLRRAGRDRKGPDGPRETIPTPAPDDDSSLPPLPPCLIPTGRYDPVIPARPRIRELA